MTPESSVRQFSDCNLTKNNLGRAETEIFMFPLVRKCYYYGEAMLIRKKYPAILIPLAVLWLTALGFATVYDLDISAAVSDEMSVYGRFFEIAGEPPAILFTSFNFFLLATYRMRCTAFGLKDKLTAFLFAVLGTGMTVFTCVKTADYIIKWQNDMGVSVRDNSVVFFLAAVTALSICAVFIVTVIKISRDKLKRLYTVFKSCVLAAVFTFAVIWALKLVWGRVRFRSMDGDYSLFTPWYVINGFTGGFSFPSGHTANATVVFTSSHYLRFLSPEIKWVKPFIYGALFVWIATVAFSRVCVGAHFLSDVLFGAAITILIIFFTRPKGEL